MKKTFFRWFIISLLLLTLLLARYETSAKASPDTIHVPQDHPTIQEAINQANPGETISVSNTTYYEHVIINKSVSLVGQDRDSTVIDGEGTDSVINVAADNVNISNLTVQNGGIRLYDSSIFVDHFSNINISHTTVKNSSNGICLSYSIRNTIFSNTASDNKYGISLYSSENNGISANNASNNRYGIALYSSNNNKICGNTAHSNKIYGIHIQSSSDNTVSSNTASNNYYGIYLHSSNNNTIHHNNFNNTDQVWSDSVNAWDGDEEGNHWSDYDGTDLYRGPYQNETGSDGIGDTPYIIDANNRDNYPLMAMFSHFEVAWEDKTHHATIICNSTISDFRFEIGRETGNKIISFNVAGEDGTVGFCRVRIPTELMNYPSIVLVDEEEIIPTVLEASNETHTCLYFTYVCSSHTVTIVSSKLMYLYNEMLDRYLKLQIDLHDLNSTHRELLDNHSTLLDNYYNTLLDNYSQLLEQYYRLNASYQELQKNHTSLLSEHAQNIRSLVYVSAATTTIIVIATVYLSTHAHTRASEAKKNRA